MHWIEIGLKVGADEASAVADILAQAGESTPAIEQEPDSTDCTVKAYLAGGRAAPRRIEEIRRKLASLNSRYPETLSEKTIHQKDWFAPIKETFTTLEVGRTLRIKASWVTAPAKDKRYTIQIDPGYAFGTGLHPTTRMCLIQLERFVTRGMTALDLGTGSGILAIAAAKLGAKSILALDTDVNAVYAAASNVRNNEVQDIIQVRRGTLSLARQQREKNRYDIVAANIVAPVISGLAARFWQILKPGGILIASGITEAGLDEVLISFALTGLTLESINQDGDWHTVVARKPTTA